MNLKYDHKDSQGRNHMIFSVKQNDYNLLYYFLGAQLLSLVVVAMSAIFWGTRGTCPLTFSDGGDIICYATQPFSL